jgi:hypothetical protein
MKVLVESPPGERILGFTMIGCDAGEVMAALQTASRASLVPPATGPTLGTARGYGEELRKVSNERLRSGY